MREGKKDSSHEFHDEIYEEKAIGRKNNTTPEHKKSIKTSNYKQAITNKQSNKQLQTSHETSHDKQAMTNND